MTNICRYTKMTETRKPADVKKKMIVTSRLRFVSKYAAENNMIDK